MDQLRQPGTDDEAGHETSFGLSPATPRGSDAGRPAAAERSWSHVLSASGRLLLQILLPLLVLAASALAYRWLVATRPDVPKQPLRTVVLPVEAVTARVASHRPVLVLYGNSVAGRQIEIRALVAGRVAEAGSGLRAGGEVAAGDTLLVIDRFDYETALKEAEAQVAEARAKLAEHEAQLALDAGNLGFLKEQLRIAEIDLRRAEPLSRQGTVAQRTVDDRRLVVSQRRQAATQLENNVALVNARIAQQKATIARLASAAARARQRLAETRLTAPFNAYVADVGAQVGRMLGVNDRVATLIDRDWIEVRFTLTDQQFGRMIATDGRLEGRKVSVRWNVARAAPRYEATIERVGARVTADSGGVEVFARIDDPLRPIPLRPGAFVEVLVPDVTFESVVRLPASAVYDRRVAYVIADGKLAPRAVEIVGSDGDMLLVRGAVADGEKVVITRLSTPGAGVRVRER
ncbi:MAG: efflux RND transporter periplasmic adaptor subunit [Hyphomicrobiaceae bacterium]